MYERADNQLFVLGALRLEHHGQEARFTRRKAASLLAYLALHPQKHSRDALATLLWGDYPDQEARTSLRAALVSLRNLLAPDVVIADSQSVQLNPTFPLWVDALAFESYARQFLAEPPFDLSATFIDLYQGDLVPDVYDDWVAPARERLRLLYVDATLHAIQLMRAHSHYQRAIDLARRVLASDPANERAHQHLMFCYMAGGDRSAALQQYDACVKALNDDLGVAPMPETTALYHWIKGSPPHTGAAEARITNLPIPLTSFIGREAEMTAVKRMLAQHRLVTLTGPGGSGKTRLGIQVAGDLVDAYKDGVWLSDLAGVQEEGGVPSAVARAVGAPAAETDDAVAALAAYLRQRNVLLVLDNCERVVAACARLCQAILSACPRVAILATSREALGVAGEALAPVPALSVPQEDGVADLGDLTPFESARLFVERAAALPGVRLVDGDARPIAGICRQLDGMPLAIELAAARLRALSAPTIAGALHERFALLASGSRSGPPRQHSLRAAIDWSYDSLSQGEQALLRRLSVFAGSFEQAGAPGVFGESKSETEVIDLLARLVDKSLVASDETAVGRRYRLLDTIKLYAWEKLEQAGEKDKTIARYLNFCWQWLLTLKERQTSSRATYADRRARDSMERDNMLRAIAWCKDTGRIEMGINFIKELWTQLAVWNARSELLDWIELALSHAHLLSPPERCVAAWLASALERQTGNWDRVEELGQKAADLARQTGDRLVIAETLCWQVRYAKDRGDQKLAVQRYQALVQVIGAEGLRADMKWVYADIAHALTRLGRLDEALPLWQEAVQAAEELNSGVMAALAAAGSGLVALQKGEGAAAEKSLREGLPMAASALHAYEQTLIIEWLAQAEAMQGRSERAAVLWGAANSAHQAGVGQMPISEADCAASTAALRQQMGEEAFQAAHGRGQAMSLEQAVAYALEE